MKPVYFYKGHWLIFWYSRSMQIKLYIHCILLLYSTQTNVICCKKCIIKTIEKKECSIHSFLNSNWPCSYPMAKHALVLKKWMHELIWFLFQILASGNYIYNILLLNNSLIHPMHSGHLNQSVGKNVGSLHSRSCSASSVISCIVCCETLLLMALSTKVW